MKGKVCLVTGVTSGIGRVTVLELAKMGAAIVVNSRDRIRGEAVVGELMELSGNRSMELLVADLSSQKDIRKMTTEFKDRHDRLHVLLNNAAIIPRRRTTTVDGIETQFAVNHLAYFLLTHLLLDVIKASAPSRIVNTSSGMHKMGKIVFDNLQRKRGYRPMGQYSVTKLANVHFTYELARRLEGTGVTVNCFTPGLTRTRLSRESSGVTKWFFRTFGRRAEKGAETMIHLASSPEVEGITGRYFSNSRAVKSCRRSQSREVSDRLWKVSEEMTGLAGFWDK
jgi:NAD(P)-dependent dehydrogenase (short-subunit alcohol dehydrogenase family)